MPVFPLILVATTARIAPAQPVVPFTEEANLRGISYYMQPFPSGGIFGTGCAFADFDNDNDKDAIIIGGKLSLNGTQGVVGLWENNGNGYFTLRTFESGIPTLPKASGLAIADFNGDGRVDIYITQMAAECHLLQNLGNFTFSDVGPATGVAEIGPFTGCSWGDYNSDGWLDLHVCSYNKAVAGFDQNDKLYKNLGNGSFQEVSAQLGVNINGYGFQSCWFDYDHDGDLDLYLSQDRGHLPPLFQPNKLWRNDHGQFTDVSEESGAGVALFSMGLACADFDRNGWQDIFVTNLASGYHRLLLNQGDSTFVESAAVAGVDGWKSSWSCIFFDYDNDGHRDLYINNQMLPNTMYRNPGTFPCVAVSGLNIEGSTGWSYVSAIADIDNDGDIEILMNNYNSSAQLLVNHHAGATRRWIEYNVVGVYPNHKAIGAKINTRTGKIWQLSEILAGGNGYLGQNDLTVHIGVSRANVAEEALIDWPDHLFQRTLTNIPTNTRWTILPPPRLGDWDNNDVVDNIDFNQLKSLYGTAVVPGNEALDFNGDFQINAADLPAFLSVCTIPFADCNNNGVNDLIDILNNPALDPDGDAVIPACNAIPGDITDNGVVDVDDLLAILGAWGPCESPCQADIAPPASPNGQVNVDDLLVVINNWS